jgi:DNA-binding response OmpR family regulator
VHSILIVEDDKATRVGLEALLGGAGYTVRTAATVPEGLRALRAATPDLLISDIRVDGYNGLQLVVEQSPPIQAIFVTGFPDPVLEADARRMGADFLLKPVEPRALLALVQQRLLRGHTEAEAEAKPIRRWPRKVVGGAVAAQVAASNARIIDVSYGGLRIVIDAAGAETLPRSFTVRVPESPAALDVDLVWKLPQAEGLWLCGLAVSELHQPAWQQVVQQLPSAAA